MREGQEVTIVTISTVPVDEVDMETTLLVGNSKTFMQGPFMVTPRGYLEKYNP